MERDNTSGNTPADVAKVGPLASSARRRLLRGSLGAAPVVLTLASRPVLATTCVTASSMASANASRPATASHTCYGKGASHWGNATTTWPSTCGKSTTFASVFGTTIFVNGTTLFQVVNGSASYNGLFYGATEKTLAKNCALAWVNFCDGKIGSDVLSVQQIKDAWTKGRTNNYPADVPSGIYWTAANVNTWLAQMWPA